MRLPDRTQMYHGLALLMLLWEMIWRAFLPLICVVGLFVALALLELPMLLPPWFHIAYLVLFGLFFRLRSGSPYVIGGAPATPAWFDGWRPTVIWRTALSLCWKIG